MSDRSREADFSTGVERQNAGRAARFAFTGR
jgi:hypothetical protein